MYGQLLNNLRILFVIIFLPLTILLQNGGQLDTKARERAYPL